MAANRITCRAAVRRGLAAGLAFAVLAAGLGGCGGGGGQPTTSVPDRDADAGTLGEVLARQLGAVEAYAAVIPALHGPARAAARRFRGYEQQHVDATVKALRGIGADADAEPERIDTPVHPSRAEALGFLYELENATIDLEMHAISRLTGEWPRTLVATMATDQAERLAAIRRELGVPPPKTVPSAFEDGTTPLPSGILVE
jgi:hypothetical protein